MDGIQKPEEYTYSDFMRTVVWNKNHGQRWGQAYMNALGDIAPMHYRIVTGSVCDPFYNDKIIPHFVAWVGDNWAGIVAEYADEDY